jgi:hypothetical protein
MPDIACPLPSAARLAPIPWLTNDLDFPVTVAATITDSVADALAAGHHQDALDRARLSLTDEDADRLVDLILETARSFDHRRVA